jgi:hypothetical protein
VPSLPFLLIGVRRIWNTYVAAPFGLPKAQVITRALVDAVTTSEKTNKEKQFNLKWKEISSDIDRAIVKYTSIHGISHILTHDERSGKEGKNKDTKKKNDAVGENKEDQNYQQQQSQQNQNHPVATPPPEAGPSEELVNSLAFALDMQSTKQPPVEGNQDDTDLEGGRVNREEPEAAGSSECPAPLFHLSKNINDECGSVGSLEEIIEAQLPPHKNIAVNFPFGRPALYFESIKMLILFLSLYCALWLTNFMIAAPTAGWVILTLLPGL